MNQFTNEDFKNFLNHYKKSDRYYNTIYEISKSDKGNPLIEIKDYYMYCLDHMKEDCKSLKDNPPKSTDAIYYNITNNELTLYLIEFKGRNLNEPNEKTVLTALKKNIELRKKECNKKKDGKACYTTQMITDLENIEDKFGDKLEIGLKEKPTESLFITIPSIYKEYCKNEKEEMKDIDTFLRNSKIKYYLFAAEYDEEEEEESEIKRVGARIIIPQNTNKSKKKNKRNKSRDYLTGGLNKDQSMGKNLNQHYSKLKKANIINHYKIKNKYQFRSFLKEEHIADIQN